MAYLRAFNIQIVDVSEKFKLINFVVKPKRDNTACQQRAHAPQFQLTVAGRIFFYIDTLLKKLTVEIDFI